jgi:hypothetical protein
VTADRVEELVDSLVWEGYALYPYTPGATKNATPTPFGIVYPPAYAAGMDGPLDHLWCEAQARLPSGSALSGEIRFLRPEGGGHRAVERRITLDGPGARAIIDEDGLNALATLDVETARGEAARVTLRVENRTVVPPGLDRAAALAHSMLSTHVVLRAGGGRFVSPLEAEGCENVNTWPVLASDGDDVIVGAAMILPDHPELAPESRGSLYDGTEIEEALLLHVMALSDAEREQIAAADPAVRAMVARAAAATPEEMLRLHGRMTMGDP